jgi:cell division protein FtsL
MTDEQQPEIIGPTKADETDAKQAEAAPQSPQPPSKSGVKVGNLALYILGALLLLFLLVGVFFIYKQSTQKPKLKTQPELQTPQQPIEELSPSPTQEGNELIVPTVSQDTSLDTIEEELNSLEVATPDADLNSLDSEASNL